MRLALGIVEAGAATQNGSPFGVELLDAMLGAIPVLTVDYLERRFGEAPAVSMVRHEVWPAQEELDELLARAGAGYPLNTTHHATSPEPLRLSDFVSIGAFRKSATYAVLMRPFGVEYELKLWLPAPPGHARAFCSPAARARTSVRATSISCGWCVPTSRACVRAGSVRRGRPS